MMKRFICFEILKRKSFLFFAIIFFFPFQGFSAEYSKVNILTDSDLGFVEKNILNLLVERLKEAGVSYVTKIEAGEIPGNVEKGTVTFIFGVFERSSLLNAYFYKNRIEKLNSLNPGLEGFLLHKLKEEDLVVLAGFDERGCLYAVGELLRQVNIRNGIINFNSEISIRTAPAFEVRGKQIGQGSVVINLGKARPWTEKETQRVILDYALAGANTFHTGPDNHDFLKSFGLMTQGVFVPNNSGTEVPKYWLGGESIGRPGYSCLAIPEAEEFMLRKCDQYFKNSPSYDFVNLKGGDGGGCECDRCDPYGKTFIHVAEKMAAIIHKYHPSTKIYFTNQKFDNDDDNAIFKYLQEKPRTWLWAWGYGPGSDATTWQPGHRQTHRMDLFRYPGYGPYRMYPKEILHQLPPEQKLIYFNEITHWKYAQHAYIQMYPRADREGNLPPRSVHDIYERRPDQYLTMVYNRLTLYAWPRYYHRVFNDLMPYSVGDITHSSGHHDHFNQWMWMRLLWSPRMTVEEVVNEYCRTWFGVEAAPYMSEALFLVERNMQEIEGCPLPEKKSVRESYNLVKKAGDTMPKELMKCNWLWRMFMQKTAIDLYTQLKVIQQKNLQYKIEAKVASLHNSKIINKEIDSILTWFKIQETPEMKKLKEEARKLGEESNNLFGQRSEGFQNLEHDFIGLGWLRRQLERAKDAKGGSKKELLAMITDYENPGEGGRYDNFGTANFAPNVLFGYPYDHGQPYVQPMLSEENRPSQRSMHFTQDEDQGVTLEYRNLDPGASYKIRFTLVRPWYQDVYSDRMNQKSEKIYAGDQLIADVELPLQMSDFFTYDIPKGTVNAEGKLLITFRRADNVARGDRLSREQWRNTGGWGTIVSEAWLIKK